MKEIGVGKQVRMYLDIFRLRYYIRTKQISASKKILESIKS